jgi:hypothetical protein
MNIEYKSKERHKLSVTQEGVLVALISIGLIALNLA